MRKLSKLVCNVIFVLCMMWLSTSTILAGIAVVQHYNQQEDL